MSPPATPNLSFGLTVLGGEGRGDVVLNNLGTVSEGDGDLVRVDIEFLARYQIGDSPLSIFVGPRYIRLEEDYSGSDFSVDSTENDIALQVGFGTATDLGASGRHRVFANIMTGVVFVDNETKVEISGIRVSDSSKDEFPLLDLNAGYQYVFGDHISLNARYRVFMVFNEDEFGFDSTFLVHGPEFGATFHFN